MIGQAHMTKATDWMMNCPSSLFDGLPIVVALNPVNTLQSHAICELSRASMVMYNSE